MTDEYIAGLVIQPNKELEEVASEISRIFPFLDFTYKDLDEFPAYKVDTDNYRVTLLGIPCVVEEDGSIHKGVNIVGDEVLVFSLTFSARCDALKQDVSELISILPTNLPVAALGGYEISSYLVEYLDGHSFLDIEVDPYPLENEVGNG